MLNETNDETSSNPEVSDAEDKSSSEATADTELYETANSSEIETPENASTELLNIPNPEAENELQGGDLGNSKESIPDKTLEGKNNGEGEKGEKDIKVSDTEAGKTADSIADRKEIYENSEYSDEINDMISSKEELEVYQKAGLKEEIIDGRHCLVRTDIDMNYISPKTGKPNWKLMQEGRVPYDAKTGERIELHHIGQEYDSPLAELTEDTEHGQFHSILHTKQSESWRNDAQKCNRYNDVERPRHWMLRAKGYKNEH